jgi:hypothetical protein
MVDEKFRKEERKELVDKKKLKFYYLYSGAKKWKQQR